MPNCSVHTSRLLSWGWLTDGRIAPRAFVKSALLRGRTASGATVARAAGESSRIGSNAASLHTSLMSLALYPSHQDPTEHTHTHTRTHADVRWKRTWHSTAGRLPLDWIRARVEWSGTQRTFQRIHQPGLVFGAQSGGHALPPIPPIPPTSCLSLLRAEGAQERAENRAAG